MFVYKVVEWYGFKVVVGLEVFMVVGVLGLFNEKR